MSMLERLKRAEERFLQIESLLAMPETVRNAERYRDLMKEYTSLEELIGAFHTFRELEDALKETLSLSEDISEDMELREMAKEEAKRLRERITEMTSELELLLLPKDPDSDKDVIVEIRGCAGGEEAALFAAVLYRMYSMYADEHGFKTELLSVNRTELGGFKEIDFQISGKGAYSVLRFESGVHRVQRVPTTESQGRIQTSTATVAVLPIAEEIDIVIDPSDIVMETCKSSGAGGQHINKTESAVRILHKPTGIVVECQEERSQFKNRDKAMKMLRTKLYDIKSREQHDKISSERRAQVGTGDRSERIRTYNYPQGRVTDHRIGLTLYDLDRILNGGMEDIFSALSKAFAAELLKKRDEGT